MLYQLSYCRIYSPTKVDFILGISNINLDFFYLSGEINLIIPMGGSKNRAYTVPPILY